jgi:transcriptional regulator with XRE-family HTH domain
MDVMSSDSARELLGQKLRYYRELDGMTLRSVCDAVNRSASHMTNVEKGRDNPSWDIVAFYEDHFGADGQIWSAYVELVTAARPPQRRKSSTRPAYPIPGDAGRFLADVTIPDGVVVPPDLIFEKIWRIRNVGTVPWIGRRLARLGAAAGYGILHSPAHVPVADTQPGEVVEIAVPLRAHPMEGSSEAHWKLVDEDGWEYFPNYPVGIMTSVTVRDDAPIPFLGRLVDKG